MRRFVCLVILLGLGAAPLAAQTTASVRIAGTTEAAVTATLAAILTPQGFELKEEKHRAIFEQDRGTVVQKTGAAMRVRRQLVFKYETRGDTVRVGTEDYLLGGAAHGGSFDAKKRVDPQQSRPVLQRILDRTKAVLEGAAPAADSTTPSASADVAG